jgi:8-oxo-dGTP pyrophosphatase MutT (NUDIX family)
LVDAVSPSPARLWRVDLFPQGKDKAGHRSCASAVNPTNIAACRRAQNRPKVAFMTDSTPTPAKPAATVVLLRTGTSAPEILLIERARSMGFAGGMWVFPGGKVDDGDLAIARNPKWARGFERLTDADAAGRVASARETFEEAGVLLSTGPALDDDARSEWRRRLNLANDHDESKRYAEILDATGHVLDAATLLPFSHWIPPLSHGGIKRFDTLFYLARLPEGEEMTPDGREAVTAHWSTAVAAIERADAGEIGVIFPTRRNLERLAQYPTIDALWTGTAARKVQLISPKIVERADGHWLTIPEDADYPITAERIESAMRG